MQIICMDGRCLKKLPVDGFKWIEKLSKFNKKFIKNYNENSNKGYLFEVDVEYPKKLLNSHRDSPFLPKGRKIREVEKLICSIDDKENYDIHIRTLRVHRVVQFYQKAWLKPYIDMDTKLRKEAKNEFEKGFFKLMNNSVFGKTMENLRSHRDIKLVTTEKKEVN